MEETYEFFSALFSAAPDDLHGHLWTLRSGDAKKTSHWFKVGDGARAVADLALSLAEDTNVYVSVSAAKSAGQPHQRIPAATSAGIYGLWADLDTHAPDVHKKMNYPPDEAAVRRILAATGVEPTMLVHSGNGLQAWWLFEEFLEFDNESDRANAANLAHRWHATLSARAAEDNYIFDSVFDLARVLRVPGTLNHKTEPPKPTSLIEVNTQRRYDLEYFEGFILSPEEIVSSGPPPSEHNYVVGDMKLNSLAQPDGRLVTAFRSNDEMFSHTLDRNRSDLKDQSASTYDLSLASQCVAVGWDDQQIIDLLIWNRRQHGDDLKLRADYYRRTLTVAHTQRANTAARAGLEDIVQNHEDAKQSGDEDDVKESRRKLLEALSAILGIRITHATRYTATKPMFAIKVEGRFDLELGVLDDMTFSKVANIFLGSDVKRDLPAMKKNEWRDAQNALVKACVDQDLGAEATEEGAMRGWLREYLSMRKPTDDVREGLATQYPFIDEAGDIHIFTKPLESWLIGSQNQRTNVVQIGRLLSRVGCQRNEKKITHNGSRTTRSFWKIPRDVMDA